MSTATITRPRPGRAGDRLRALPRRSRERIALAGLALGAVWTFFAVPTYPSYDASYALLWGRELLHGATPSFSAYRAPTEHPLAIALGALLEPVGAAADRALVAVALAAFVALVGGLYRLGRDSFSPAVGVAAALLLCGGLHFESLALRGYADVAFLALVVWAGALEAERSRRGVAVLALLAAAGLIRPDAWLLSALYAGWLARSTPGRGARLRLAALALLAPAAWSAFDAALTGDPLFSLHATHGLAGELGRRRDLGEVVRLVPVYLLGALSPPVAAAALAGLGAALALAPRRAVLPAVGLLSGLISFLLVGLFGLSVIPRYLVVAQVALVLFAGLALAGFTLLSWGTRARRLWALGAALALLAAAGLDLAHAAPRSLLADVRLRSADHVALGRLLDRPAVRAGLGCGAVSVPDHRLVPEVRWALDLGRTAVVARSDRRQGWLSAPRPRARAQRGVAIFVTDAGARARLLGASAQDPRIGVPRVGFTRVAEEAPFVAYAACPRPPG